MLQCALLRAARGRPSKQENGTEPTRRARRRTRRRGWVSRKRWYRNGFHADCMRRARDFRQVRECRMINIKSPAPQQGTPPTGTSPTRLPPRKAWLIFVVLLFVNYLIMRYLFPGPGEPVTIP